jgi:hypothetical protein
MWLAIFFHVINSVVLLVAAYGLFRRRLWAWWLTSLLTLETAAVAILFGVVSWKEFAYRPEIACSVAFIAASGLHAILTHAYFWRSWLRREFRKDTQQQPARTGRETLQVILAMLFVGFFLVGVPIFVVLAEARVRAEGAEEVLQQQLKNEGSTPGIARSVMRRGRNLTDWGS